MTQKELSDCSMPSMERPASFDVQESSMSCLTLELSGTRQRVRLDELLVAVHIKGARIKNFAAFQQARNYSIASGSTELN